MKKAVLLIFLLSFSFLFGQNQEKVDSCDKRQFYIDNIEDKSLIEAVDDLFEKRHDDAFVRVKKYKVNSESNEEQFVSLLEADILYETASYKKALGIYNRLLKQDNLNGEVRFYSLMNIANIQWSHLKDFKGSAHYYEKAESLLNSSSCEEKRLLVYQGLGTAYLYTKRYKESEASYNKALKIYEQRNDAEYIAKTYSNLANLFYEQYQDAKAELFFLKAYDAVKDTEFIEVKRKVLYNLYAVNEGLGKYKEALKYLSQSNVLKDSIWNRDKVWELAEKDKEISITQKDKELFIQTEKTEKQTRRLQWGTGILVLVLLFLGTLYYSYKTKVKQNKIITAQKGDLEKLNHAKNYLFSVISHDLRSPVKMLIKHQHQFLKRMKDTDVSDLEASAGSVLTIAEGLNHLLNNVLHWSLEQNDQMIFDQSVQPVDPIIHQVLFDFQLLAQEKGINIETNLEEELFMNIDRESIKVVLRNLLDNAIKYTPEDGTIKISTFVKEEVCFIQVQDSGIGIAEEQLQRINSLQELSIEKINRSKGIGLGLLLCTTLTQKNGGTFQVSAELNKGTMIQMTFPIAKEEF